jgi:xylan 1,4-beta-xylosidase
LRCKSQSNGSERLELPFYNWWSEALYGIGYAPGVRFADSGPFSSATSFPVPVLMAATFDDDLIEDIGTVIGIEARAWGNAGYSGIDFWTPNVNPFKDPRWGRGSETPRRGYPARQAIRGTHRPRSRGSRGAETHSCNMQTLCMKRL